MQKQKRDLLLVTGAEGFLGRTLVDLLQRSGRRVIALDSRQHRKLREQSSVTKVLCDIADQQQLERVFREHEIGHIVHLAAVLPTAAQQDPVHATRVNVAGSANLMQLARQFGVVRFVFGSSLSIYGSCSPDHVVSEKDRAAPEDVYGAAKLYAEQLGGAFHHSGDLQFVSLRIGRIVGPGARSSTSAWRSAMFELLQAKAPAQLTLPFVGSERVLLVHVDDVARALLALIDAPVAEHTIYNAPCESWLVEDLKQNLEALNPRICVSLGHSYAEGNPRLLDWSRFQKEFAFSAISIAERLRTAAE